MPRKSYRQTEWSRFPPMKRLLIILITVNTLLAIHAIVHEVRHELAYERAQQKCQETARRVVPNVLPEAWCQP